jgi:hypothetical protein
LQAVLFVLFDDGSDLRMVNKGSQPKLWNPTDNFIPLVVKRPPQFVVLLLYLQDLLTSLCKNKLKIFF